MKKQYVDAQMDIVMLSAYSIMMATTTSKTEPGEGEEEVFDD